MRQIVFVKNGYDPFIDFIKAYAIICVLIGHTIPYSELWGYGLWAGMQVPLFILIQSFHFFKREANSVSIKKIFNRVLLPFLVVEILTLLIALLFKIEGGGKSLIHNAFIYAGLGPGSYYPWIYLQVAVVLPFFLKWFKRIKFVWLLTIMLLLSEGLEVLCSISNVPEVIYRLLAVRYVFLVFLGWLWVKKGVKLSPLTILLSILSLLAIVYFEYFSVNDEPWFFTTGWKYHRWPCYFWVSSGIVYILNCLWNCVKKSKKITDCVRILAKSSYEIFLVQMSFIYLFNKNSLYFFDNKYLSFFLWLVIVWFVSILGGVYFNKLYDKIKNFKSCIKTS